MGLISSIFGAFNERELQKLRSTAASNPAVRLAISRALMTVRPLIERARELREPQRREALLALVNAATETRHEALRKGARSYADPEWAAASAVETWLHALLSGSPKNVERVEALVAELIHRT